MKPHLGRYDKAGIGADGKKDKQALQMGPIDLVSHHHHHHGEGHMSHTTTSTTYFVTFQVDSGDRMELPVGGYEFGMLAEGDRGKLSFQGTRYLGFQRQ